MKGNKLPYGKIIHLQAASLFCTENLAFTKVFHLHHFNSMKGGGGGLMCFTDLC